MYAEFFRYSGFAAMTVDNAADALAHAPDVLTASVWKPQRERAEAARCDVFLPKPCLPDHLLAEVRRLLAVSRVLRKRRATAVAKVDRLRAQSAELFERSRAVERKHRA